MIFALTGLVVGDLDKKVDRTALASRPNPC